MDYQKLFNTNAASIPPSGIRKFFDLLDGMEDVISLGVGQPDLPVSETVCRVYSTALESGRVPYTSNAGLPVLRERIAAYLDRRFGLSYAPDREMLVTVGGSEAIDLMLRALVGPGDEVIVPQPSFVCYGPLTRLCGGVEVPVETVEEESFRLTPERLRAVLTSKTKVLVLPYPCNPTGAVMTRPDLEALAEVLAGTDVMVLSDEVYAELSYDAPHVSPAVIPGLRERTVVIGSASKSLSMTGARLGFAAGPEPVITTMTRIHQYAVMSAPTVAQLAAAEAFPECDGELDRQLHIYDRRRCLMLGGFASMGMPCHAPAGTFYLFPDIRQSGLDSMTFCERLLTEARVAVIPGTAFGACGEGYVRLCFAADEAQLKEALRRIAGFWHSVIREAA